MHGSFLWLEQKCGKISRCAGLKETKERPQCLGVAFCHSLQSAALGKAPTAGDCAECGRVTKTRGQEGSVWEMTMCIMDGSVTSRPQRLERVMGLSQEGPEEG